jgi:SAM-dependent methyltransferase
MKNRPGERQMQSANLSVTANANISEANIPENDRLNLGCGPNAPAGWINVDGSWNAWFSHHPRLRGGLRQLGIINASNQGAQWNVRPVVHDLRKPLPFPENAFSAIYASHVLEHLYRVEADALLAECKRVLKPGGTLRLVVPDLHFLVLDYLKGRNGQSTAETRWVAADTLNQKLGFRSVCPPGGNVLFRFYALWKDFHSHKWMYDADSLSHALENAGFEPVAQKGFHCSEIPGIEEVEDSGRVLDGVGVCIEGQKRSGSRSRV